MVYVTYNLELSFKQRGEMVCDRHFYSIFFLPKAQKKRQNERIEDHYMIDANSLVLNETSNNLLLNKSSLENNTVHRRLFTHLKILSTSKANGFRAMQEGGRQGRCFHQLNID